jgi:undecaprenyl-diphosphatase
MTLLQALILGLIQGVSELFPVSSLAQSILIPALFFSDFHLDRDSAQWVAFLVLLHFATAVALLIYFWADWRKVFLAYIGSAQRGKFIYDRESKFAWLLVAGTLIVCAVAFILDKHIEKLFTDAHTTWVAGLLIINGAVMLLGDLLKKRSLARAKAGGELKQAEDMPIRDGALVGASQTLALLPGISRSGVTIIGGLLAGLSYEEACRFGFMLATPVIMAAAAFKAPQLLKPGAGDVLHQGLLAAVVAGVAAYFSVKFLMRYFRHNHLWPFGVFCIAFGGFALFMLTGHARAG